MNKLYRPQPQELGFVSRETPAFLQASGLTAGYGAKQALHAVDIAARPGTMTFVVGPNGSGKSTLLRCLAGALRPSGGKVTLNRVDVSWLHAHQMRQWIAYVPQETTMPFAFTVAELVALSLEKSESPRGQAVSEVITALNLEPLMSSALNSLSGGEQQRASLARGIAQKARCLLLDEPTAHLDLRFQVSLFRLLRKQCRESGTTLIIVLHDLVLASRYADQVVLLNKGHVAGAGTVAEVFTEPLLEEVYEVPLQIGWQHQKIASILAKD